MNEPPGARARVGLSALTVAEYFRDEEGQDVLLFIDNIFRFTQAGSEVSALLGRIPSRRRLPADALDGDGRAPGAHHLDQQGLDHLGAGDLRARRRPHRPGAGHDVRPPRRDDGALAADRRARHLPGRRPARLDRRDPRPAGRRRGALPGRARRAADAPEVQGPPGHHRDPRHGRALARTTSSSWRARARSRSSCRSRSTSPSSSPARRASYVRLKDTIRGFKEILDGKHDDLPEQAFYMVGTIEDAVAKAKTLV